MTDTQQYGKIKALTCCCGSSTRGRQWWNRDTGYGLCTDCVEFCKRGETEDSFRRLYGEKGVHYAVEGQADPLALLS